MMSIKCKSLRGEMGRVDCYRLLNYRGLMKSDCGMMIMLAKGHVNFG